MSRYTGAGSLAVRAPDGAFVAIGRGRAVVRNKRQAPRFDTSALVGIDARPGLRSHPNELGELTNAIVRDVSVGGMRIQSRAVDGTLVYGAPISVHLPTQPPVSLPARVVWRRDDEVGVAVAIAGEDVRFAYETWLSHVADYSRSPLAEGSASHPRETSEPEQSPG